MAEDAGILSFLISVQDRFSAPVGRMMEHVEKLKQSFTTLAVAAPEIFAGYEFGKHVVESAEAFQTAQLALQQVTGATTAQLREAQKQADALSVSYGVSAEAVTGLQAQMAQFTGGLASGEAAATLAVKLMTATHMDAAAAGKVLGAALTDLRVPGETAVQTMKRVSDQVTTLVTKFPSAGESATSMGRDVARAASAMKTFDLNQAQTMALLGIINRTGIAGTRGSGLYLSDLANALFKPDKHGVAPFLKAGLDIHRDSRTHQIDLIKTLEEASPVKLHGLEQSLGQEGQVLALLIPLLKDWKKATLGMADASGATDKQVAATQKTLALQIANFEDALSDLSNQVGQPVLPALTWMTRAMSSLTGGVVEFLDWSPALKEGIGMFLSMSAAALTVLGLVKAVSALTDAMQVLKIATLENPWIAIPMALAAAAVLIYENWGSIKSGSEAAMSWLVNANTVAANAIDAAWDASVKWVESVFTGAWNLIKSAVETGIAFVRSHMLLVAAAFGPFGVMADVAVAVVDHWGAIKAAFGEGVAWIEKEVALLKPVLGDLEAAFGAVSRAWDWVTGHGGAAPPAAAAGAGAASLAGGDRRAGVTVSQPITVTQHITVKGGAGGSAQQTAAAVKGAAASAAHSLVAQLKQAQADNNRTVFGDTRYSTAY